MKTQLITRNTTTVDTVIIEDTLEIVESELNPEKMFWDVKWYIEVTRIDGRLSNVREFINPIFLQQRPAEYINDVYQLAIEESEK